MLALRPAERVDRRTVSRKNVTKCRPLSLCPYDGIFWVDRPRYAESRTKSANEAGVVG